MCRQKQLFPVRIQQVSMTMAELSSTPIVRDTPNTRVAAVRFKKFAAKGSKEAVSAMRDVLIDVVSETVKKAI